MTKVGRVAFLAATLGALKAARALGLLVRIGVPQIGITAAIGLVLFFVGAIAVMIRTRRYSHVPWSATYLVLAMASLALRLTAA
jgi:DoxX-like family